MKHHFIHFQFELEGHEEYEKDLFMQDLADSGFESFDETEESLNAYISSLNFEEDKVNEVIENQETPWKFKRHTLDIVNWNSEWEKNFSPILLDKQCYVRADFHPERKDIPYEIIINPKMAFGTGHHATTFMMMEWMFELEFRGKSVLDMGCGTGILAILAHKLGAASVYAIDNDPIAVDNALECVDRNQTADIQVDLGDNDNLAAFSNLDILIANINRNILLEQIEGYSKALKQGGILLLSGFYNGEDVEVLSQEAKKYGFSVKGKKVKEQWASLSCIKEH
jgi:ribosomal protein L11 methyltransferase